MYILAKSMVLQLITGIQTAEICYNQLSYINTKIIDDLLTLARCKALITTVSKTSLSLSLAELYCKIVEIFVEGGNYADEYVAKQSLL